MRQVLLALALAVVALASSAAAQCPRCGQFHPPYDRQPVRQVMGYAGGMVQATAGAAMGAVRGARFGAADALAEVNAARTRRGLRPFIYDPLLTQGAMACADERARRRIKGHLPNDFGYLPPGASARSAGCGAMDASWGWNTCCTYERYTYAGAAYSIGADGKRYMHLFVR